MFRPATEDDLLALAELERDANLVGLRHVFPPELYPFPFDAVLARWRLVLDDPSAVVLVTDAEADRTGLDAFVCHDDAMLRHVAVHPSRWGEGLASAGLGIAVAAMSARSTATATLWVLELNDRARRLYERLGWAPTDDRREAPWPPHPTEVRYELDLRG